jgi:hypothetical protein
VLEGGGAGLSFKKNIDGDKRWYGDRGVNSEVG